VKSRNGATGDGVRETFGEHGFVAIVLIILAIGVIALAYKKWRELKKSGTIVEGAA
jgi:uncharacterized membrane protein YidH (DUF202 family)